MKGRLDEDDFIVDDDGSGYVDNGEDDWDRHSDQHDSDDDGKSKQRDSSICFAMGSAARGVDVS